MRLIHVADAHLGAAYEGFGALAGERAEEVLAAFRRLPEEAAEARADAVLLAGDLFDGPQPGPEALGTARSVLRRLVDLCIPVFLVPGNHDSVTLKLNPYVELARGSRVVVQSGDRPDARRWPVRDDRGRQLAEKHSVYILARPRFGSPITVETDAGPLHVYGAAYDRAECEDPLVTFRRKDGDGVHVAMLHACVRSGDDWRMARNALTVATDALQLLDVDYIALGDQHRPSMPTDFDDLPACYSGSFAATSPAESGPRGYLVVDVEPGGIPRVEHRDAGVRQAVVAEVDVSACASDEAVAESTAAVIASGAIPTVRLVGEPEFPLDGDAVGDALIERFGHAVVVDETRYYSADRLEDLAATETVAGHVVRIGRRRIADAPTARHREVAQQALRVALRGLGAS